VKDQLSQQQIAFKTAAGLTDEEKQSACLVKYAGLQLTTGKQAECYANEFIGLRVKSTAAGRTYSTQGDSVTGLKAQLAAAQKPGSPDAGKTADLNAQITTATAARETLFKGERDPPRPPTARGGSKPDPGPTTVMVDGARRRQSRVRKRVGTVNPLKSFLLAGGGRR